MQTPFRRGLRAALLGLLVNGLLAVIKLLAGIVGHSFALIADAVESLADVVTSSIVVGALHLAAQPADEDHPYGHGKADSLAALVVAQMLLVAALAIAIQAVREILHPHQVPARFTLWVLIGVIVVKETLYRFVWRVGTATGSTVMHAEAWHHRSDAITSLAALVGIGIATFGGERYAAADDWAALAVSGIIAFNGVRFLRRALHDLMDGHAPAEVIESARRAALAVQGVHGVEKILARKMGFVYLVDMHIEVDPGLSVRAAHEIAHGAKACILAVEPRVGDVLVHVEPDPQMPEAGRAGASVQT